MLLEELAIQAEPEVYSDKKINQKSYPQIQTHYQPPQQSNRVHDFEPTHTPCKANPRKYRKKQDMCKKERKHCIQHMCLNHPLRGERRSSIVIFISTYGE